jgi:hypothetical protein
MKIQHSIQSTLSAKFILIIFVLHFLLQSSSCRKGGKCEEALDVVQSGLICIFKNASGSYLYTEANPIYNKDSLIISDETGRKLSIVPQLQLIPNTSSRYWQFDFGPLFIPLLDADSFNKEVCRNYYIRYKYNESDTLKICFIAQKTDCGSIFKSLKVFSKTGSLITEASNITTTSSTIIKN